MSCYSSNQARTQLLKKEKLRESAVFWCEETIMEGTVSNNGSLHNSVKKIINGLVHIN